MRPYRVVFIPALVVGAAGVPSADAANLQAALRVVQTHANVTTGGVTVSDPDFDSNSILGELSQFIDSEAGGDGFANAMVQSDSNVSETEMSLRFEMQANAEAVAPNAADAGGSARYSVEFEITKTEYWTMRYLAANAKLGSPDGDTYKLTLERDGMLYASFERTGDFIFARAMTLPPGSYVLNVVTTLDVDGVAHPGAGPIVLTEMMLLPQSEPCPGDAQGDRVVDFIDLNFVLSDYGDPGELRMGDVNGDGVVDFLDLNLVLSYYGEMCPA